MKATKIKMKPGCGTSNNLLEIDSIYLTGAKEEKLYAKAAVHDYIDENPGSIQVDIAPFPNLVPVTSSQGEKYVRSAANDSTADNLLQLPRV